MNNIENNGIHHPKYKHQFHIVMMDETMDILSHQTISVKLPTYSNGGYDTNIELMVELDVDNKVIECLKKLDVFDFDIILTNNSMKNITEKWKNRSCSVKSFEYERLDYQSDDTLKCVVFIECGECITEMFVQ